MVWGTVRRAARRLAADAGGNIAVLSALSTPVVLVLCAVAIDAITLFVERREAQAMTDLAAITAANSPGNATTLARQVFEDNGVVADDYTWPTDLSASAASLAIETGRYDANVGIPVDSRFAAGGTPTNAVRVYFNKPGQLHFANMFAAAPTIGAAAVAYSYGEASFTVGSRLASLSGGAANAILSGLLGTSVSLTVMDYESLLGLDVDLFQFMDALASDLELEAASYTQILATQVGIADILTALVEVAPSASVAQAALTSINTAFAAKVSPTPQISLNEVFGLGSLANAELGNAGSVVISAMEIVTATATVANGTSQVTTGININAGGLATVSTNVSIGEPPQPGLLVATRENELVRTAQTRLTLTMSIGGSGTIASVSLPLYLEVAYAEAQVENVSCPPGGAGSSVDILVKPAIARLWIGTPAAGAMTSFTGPASVDYARLANVNLLFLGSIGIDGRSFVEAGGGSQTVTFTEAEVAAGTVKTVSTGSPIASVTDSLIDELDVSIAGIGLSLGVVEPLLEVAIGAVAPQLDSLVNDLLGTMGVSIGEADVRVLDIGCQRAVLVQ